MFFEFVSSTSIPNNIQAIAETVEEQSDNINNNETYQRKRSENASLAEEQVRGYVSFMEMNRRYLASLELANKVSTVVLERLNCNTLLKTHTVFIPTKDQDKCFRKVYVSSFDELETKVIEFNGNYNMILYKEGDMNIIVKDESDFSSMPSVVNLILK